MPRGQKSRARAREKRRQTKTESQELEGTQTMPSEQKGSSSSSAQASGDAVPSPSSDTLTKLFQGMSCTTTFSICIACKRADTNAKSRRKQNMSSSMAQQSKSPKQDLLTRKTGMLMEYMLSKYKHKEPLLREEMLNVVTKSFKEQFPEILKKASNRMDMVFGLELKEIQPKGRSYELVSKLDFQDDGSGSSELGVPTRGILIPLLSVIYLNNYCAPEKEVWHFLNMLGVYDGVPHIIFGNARKLITEDLVQEEYLEYREVPDSDPPSYQFLWGSKAYSETSQVKVMEFLARINETDSSPSPSNHEESFKAKDKTQAEGTGQGSTKSKAKKRSKAKSRMPTPTSEI
ncbi:rCG36485 [Rattus norvegicus]|uniref:MAGE family member B7 n=2 Tax=Rattus norvegicus TaxID=10116 RepID=A0A8I5ZWY3_RAT|nr:MAGE family member B7 [Rattus norvegicus]EDL96040.1 rCG36485 [Rattus norvegicus]|eukprot:NP_001102837.1 melanoma antigen, family B, 7 [Rattus norvegicus]